MAVPTATSGAAICLRSRFVFFDQPFFSGLCLKVLSLAVYIAKFLSLAVYKAGLSRRDGNPDE